MRITPLGQTIAAATLVFGLSVPAFADEQRPMDLGRLTCDEKCEPEGSSEVPEPGMLGLLGLGLAGVYLAGRRRKS